MHAIVHEDIDFTWNATIEGAADGRIRYELDGVCHGTFRYSKIGFNVHHALDSSVGHAYRARTEGGELRGTLPESIVPQRIVNGTLTGMFDPYSKIAIEVAHGFEAIVALEGDLLELQDHRNWIDGNFKSYATPLALGFPFDATDGQRIHQVLTVGFAGPVPAAEPERLPTISVGEPIGGLPPIGFGRPSHGQPLSEREAELIRRSGRPICVSTSRSAIRACRRRLTGRRPTPAPWGRRSSSPSTPTTPAGRRWRTWERSSPPPGSPWRASWSTPFARG